MHVLPTSAIFQFALICVLLIINIHGVKHADNVSSCSPDSADDYDGVIPLCWTVPDGTFIEWNSNMWGTDEIEGDLTIYYPLRTLHECLPVADRSCLNNNVTTNMHGPCYIGYGDISHRPGHCVVEMSFVNHPKHLRNFTVGVPCVGDMFFYAMAQQ